MISQDIHKRYGVKKTHDVIVQDPVCGMELYSGQAFVRHYGGKMSYFCCPECKKIFESMAKAKSPQFEHVAVPCLTRGDAVVSF